MHNRQYNTQTLHPPAPSPQGNTMQIHNTKTQCKNTLQTHSTQYNGTLHPSTPSPNENNANTQCKKHNTNTPYTYIVLIHDEKKTTTQQHNATNTHYTWGKLHPPTPSPNENTMRIHSAKTQNKNTMQIHNTKTQCKYTIQIHNTNTQYYCRMHNIINKHFAHTPLHLMKTHCKYTLQIHNTETQCKYTILIHNTITQYKNTMQTHNTNA